MNALRPSIESGRLQLYCVDSVDSETLYCRMCVAQDRLRRHTLYEEYILNEVLPLSDSKNPGSSLIAHGCSIGAYHAVNIAFRHPHLFRKVVALSGRYDLGERLGCFDDLFQGFYSEDVYFHTPNHFIRGMTDETRLKHLRQMEICLVVGREDPFYSSTLNLSQALREKCVDTSLCVWDGEAHRARYWREMVRVYL